LWKGIFEINAEKKVEYKKLPDTDAELLAECKVETFRSSGPGGQHANATDSAVRLTHLPTGIVVSSQKERSQYRNKQICLKRLRGKIENLLRKPKKRIPTKMPERAKLKRRKEKIKKSQKKKLRSNPSFEDEN